MEIIWLGLGRKNRILTAIQNAASYQGKTLREVFLVRIESECGKIRTRKTPNTDTFQAVNFFRKTHVR